MCSVLAWRVYDVSKIKHVALLIVIFQASLPVVILQQTIRSRTLMTFTFCRLEGLYFYTYYLVRGDIRLKRPSPCFCKHRRLSLLKRSSLIRKKICGNGTSLDCAVFPFPTWYIIIPLITQWGSCCSLHTIG